MLLLTSEDMESTFLVIAYKSTPSKHSVTANHKCRLSQADKFEFKADALGPAVVSVVHLRQPAQKQQSCVSTMQCSAA